MVNPLKPYSEIDANAGAEGYLDLRFSKKYPKLVKGDGYRAERPQQGTARKSH